jgi:hypothetical protein
MVYDNGGDPCGSTCGVSLPLVEAVPEFICVTEMLWVDQAMFSECAGAVVMGVVTVLGKVALAQAELVNVVLHAHVPCQPVSSQVPLALLWAQFTRGVGRVKIGNVIH